MTVRVRLLTERRATPCRPVAPGTDINEDS
jgi:hypothetical protein